jgi:hypothetical protein
MAGSGAWSAAPGRQRMPGGKKLKFLARKICIGRIRDV